MFNYMDGIQQDGETDGELDGESDKNILGSNDLLVQTIQLNMLPNEENVVLNGGNVEIQQ